MFRPLLLLALVCTYRTALANPVIKSPNVFASYISELAQSCTKNYFLSNGIENITSDCSIPVPPYNKPQLLCLAYYDLNDQLCQAIEKNNSFSVSEETYNKFSSSKVTLEEVCQTPVRFQNITDFPAFKSSIEKVFNNDNYCHMLCDANPEELLNPKVNPYCKFIRWATTVLESLHNDTSSPKTTTNLMSQNVDDSKKTMSSVNTNTDLNSKPKAQLEHSQESLRPTNQQQLKPFTEDNIAKTTNGIKDSPIDSKQDTVKGHKAVTELVAGVKVPESSKIPTTVKPKVTSDDPDSFDVDTYGGGGSPSIYRNLDMVTTKDVPLVRTETRNNGGGGSPSIYRNLDMVTTKDVPLVRMETRNNVIESDYEEADDSFFPLFLSAIIIVAVLYILYHNKSKITKVVLGLLVEGRQGRRRNSRGHSYKRLDTLEQAMSTGTSSAPPSKIIY